MPQNKEQMLGKKSKKGKVLVSVILRIGVWNLEKLRLVKVT